MELEPESKQQLKAVLDREEKQLMMMKIERLSTKVRQLEDKTSSDLNNISKHLEILTAEMARRKNSEAKIEEMISKHNQIVRSFEARMNEMKRVLEQQEIQIYRTTNELEQARRQLSKIPKT